MCADAALESLDRALNLRYRIVALTDGRPSTLQAGQREWLAARDRCTTAACVRSAYARRLQELSERTPVPGVGLRTMPGRFHDAWLFYATDDAGPVWQPGEPVWLLPAGEMPAGPPAAQSPHWWDLGNTPHHATPLPLKRGRAVEGFGFFSGKVVAASLAGGTPQRPRLRIGGQDVTLARVPEILVARTSLVRLTDRPDADPFAARFASGCLPFGMLLQLQVPGLPATSPAWYGVRFDGGPRRREGHCDDDELAFRHDDGFGSGYGRAWGDGNGPRLADGSLLLVSGWWDQLSVLRLLPSGEVAGPAGALAVRVDPDRLRGLRSAAVAACSRQDPIGIPTPACLVAHVEAQL